MINRGQRKECASCAAWVSDGATFPRLKNHATLRLCTDCTIHDPIALPAPRRPKRMPQRKVAVVTRAQYRARYRRRLALPQMDWVDAAVPAP